jgi:hypothetical protein
MILAQSPKVRKTIRTEKTVSAPKEIKGKK